MSLIIGIKCTDGVVMGADGAATLGTVRFLTVRQPVKKLSIIKENVIVGCSGHVGLGQRIQSVIEGLWDKEDVRKRMKSADLMTLIRQEIWKHISLEIQAATLAQQLFGPTAQQSALSQTLVALPVLDKPVLFQFDQQGTPEEATADLPFVAIGGGQPIADPFLAFLRRIFWPNNQSLTVAHGIFAVLWALEHSIQTTPGGVADPKQLVVLDRQGAKWKAYELSDNELAEHYQAIGEAEKALRGFRDSLPPTAEAEVPFPVLPKE